MKKLITILLCLPMIGLGQSDIIYTVEKEKIICSIKEISSSEVKFSYPKESLINIINKNLIEKIVFSSGRVQEFSSTNFNEIKDVNDWDKVMLTELESDVKGLYRIGDVSSKAKGTTALANTTKVRERSIKKLKAEAAMMGANIVFLLDMASTANKAGTKYSAGQQTSTVISGVAYSNTIPKYDLVSNKLTGKELTVTETHTLHSGWADYKILQEDTPITLSKIYKQNGFVYVNCELGDNLMVTKIYDDYLILMWFEKRAKNQISFGKKIFNAKVSFK